MNATLSRLQRDVTLLRSQLAPPPAPMPILDMAARLGLTLDSWQFAAVQSEAPRVLLNIHRQGGKSLLMALLGLHAILSQPRSLVLTISPTERQIGLLFRQLLDFYRQLGSPVPSTIENRLSLELANGSTVYALPGSEANIRGFSGVDLILADEASRIDDAMMGAVRPMFSVSNGRLIAASTPAGQRGWWFMRGVEGGDDWQRFEVRADQCPRISADFLAAERRALPSLIYQAEYACQFVETTDAVFRFEDIQAALSPGLIGIRLFTEGDRDDGLGSARPGFGQSSDWTALIGLSCHEDPGGTHYSCLLIERWRGRSYMVIPGLIARAEAAGLQRLARPMRTSRWWLTGRGLVPGSSTCLRRRDCVRCASALPVARVSIVLPGVDFPCQRLILSLSFRCCWKHADSRSLRTCHTPRPSPVSCRTFAMTTARVDTCASVPGAMNSSGVVRGHMMTWSSPWPWRPGRPNERSHR